MGRLESSFFDLGAIDTLSGLDTPVHRLDPRVKLLTTLLFIVTVLSFDKYRISALLPFCVYPVALAASGNLPFGTLARKILLAAPFALCIGAFNPLLDREVLLHLGPVSISGGWVSFASILLRFLLTVSAALVLVACTGFHAVCAAMEKLGVPRVFVQQLLFLYRYLFVLVDEAGRMAGARALRSFGGRGSGIRVHGYLLGQWLLRTLDRAQRIHLAMLCRGFDGEVRLLRPMRIRAVDWAYLAGWALVFAGMRLVDIPQGLGKLATGILS